MVGAQSPELVWQRDLTSWTYNLVFSADGSRLVAFHGDTLSVIDAADAALVQEIRPKPPRGTRAMALSARDELAVTAGTYIDLYDLGSTVSLDRIPCSACNRVIDGLAFSPDGRWLAFQDVADPMERARGIGAVRVLNLDSQRVAVELRGVGIGSIPTVAFSRDGQKLLASHVTGKDVGFRVWDTSDWKVLLTKVVPDMGSIATGAIRGAEFVAVYGNQGNVEMRDLNRDVVLWSVPMVRARFDSFSRTESPRQQQFGPVAVAPDGSFIVTYEGRTSGGVEGSIVVRRARDGTILAQYDVFDVTSMAIAPDSETFAFTFRVDQHGHRLIVARIPSVH
jgi:hypothetical protein